ncbi:ABC transporter permease [Suttonella ornithocola]|uniref:Autoinducer 2 import system permease protein lsrD n=1 Tax=Suttonella ornithocola TaxID=279832 RepID=A0A380MQ09_9GAMM|nr:ABC transporter permease [Suttonella ornithocola]SUO94368.1 Autoinducer 2 import system permease protein lsrD [Suttonella ornithocola]
MKGFISRESALMLGFLGISVAIFALIAPNTLSIGSLRAMAYQIPELGLLTLAMLIPILSGGLNLAITYTANICALVAAAFLTGLLPSWGIGGSLLACFIALIVGGFIGAIIGMMIAWVGAHPILVTLGAMILLRGIGEWLTRGGDISGMPALFEILGHGVWLGLPIPLWIFLVAASSWFYLMHYTRFGFSVYMIGSNPKAALFSGIAIKKIFIWIYTLSGVMAALAGLLMLARFNSVRMGHGESYLLITILACFLSGADPFGGFGRVFPLVIALFALQLIASGLNMLGANQHLVTAIWGIFLIVVMIIRALLQKRKSFI